MQSALSKFKRFLERRYPNRSTTKHYMSDLAIFSDFMGEKTLRTVNAKCIDEFVQWQSEQGLKAATINRRLSAISSFFDYQISEAEDDKWQNPVYWKRHSVRQGHHLPRDVSDATVEQLFTVITEHRDRAMFTLMVSAGLRVGEVIDLTLDDVQEPSTSSLTRLRVCGKGEKERVVWLTSETMYQLQSWLQERPISTEPYLFLNQHNRRLSVAGVQYRLKQYCEQANIKLTCHQLRHTFARRLAEQKMPIESLAKLLGHNALQTTQRYIDGADPGLRDEFLRAMACEQPDALSPQAPSTLPLEAPLTPDVRPDPDELLAKVAHLGAELPDWLQAELRQHTLRRISRWPSHRAQTQARMHFSTLCRICRWLVLHREWHQLEQLQRTDLVAYVNQRLEGGLKPQSIAAELTIFRIFWRDLLTQERVTNGTLLQVKAPVASDRLPRFLTRTEFYRLERIVQDETAAGRPKDVFNRTWFYLLAHTGLRLSELLNLRLSDCDFVGRRLRVQSGKGDRDRVLPLTDHLGSLLSTYLALRESAQTDHLLIYKEAAVKSQLIPHRLRRFGSLAGIEPMTPHRLRHTLATLLINQGMPIVSLQKFLGHQDINNTLIYARVHDETVKKQFATAMTNIETVPVPDWPLQLQSIVNSPIYLSDSSNDSV